MSTPEQREHNGRTILDLCALGERILEAYGIPPERAKVPERISMNKSTCMHCGDEIGEWTDPWGGHREWMHAPDDGPDAYMDCRCNCADCYQPLGTGPCIDGEVAEPKLSCDGCGGSGLVPANSGSDVADCKCGECNGRGIKGENHAR